MAKVEKIKCKNCDKLFLPARSDWKFCQTPCKTLTGDRLKIHKLKHTIKRYELEVVETMHLVQLERKKIEDLKVYRVAYNRIRDYITNSVEPNMEDLKRICNVQDQKT